jgi:subtilisin family serine protease
LTKIGADRVWNELGIIGEGIVIGQSDSGVQGDHPEFTARYRGASEGDDYNWLDPWEASPSPVDDNGHGTHTLGSVLGDSVGVAPGATWFACANLVRNLGNPAFYLECMQFMLAPFPQGGDPLHEGDPSRAADVLNNSWGCPATYEGCTPDVFAPAVDALSQAGIFVVVSAGNEGPLCSSLNTPPAIYASVLTVGAVDEAGNLAIFSSVGPVTVDESGRTKPDVLAPGVDVLSSWPGSAYVAISGTSMAGPHLAGTVALMWSANPTLRGDIERTRAIIQETAQPFQGGLEGSESAAEDAFSDTLADSTAPLAEMMGVSEASCLAQMDLNQLPNNAAGYGVVDVFAAVQSALVLQ